MTVTREVQSEPLRSERAWVVPLKLGAAGFLLLAAIGASAGATMAALERGWTGYRMGVVAGFVILSIALAAWLVRSVQRLPDRAIEARNIGTARKMTIASGVIGGLLGLLLPLIGLLGGGEPDPMAAFTDAPLPPWVALAVIAVLCLVIPVSLIWHRSIDEHESNAYRFGALLAVNAYFFLSSVWWFAARGGFVSAPDGMAIFFVTVTTWGLGWAWARFR